ncbi:MAG: DUF2169 domain-containing protein [Byssovorax sp.]
MNVISVGPFLTDAIYWRPATDLWVLTVIAKATFALKPGKVTLAAEQQTLHGRDSHWSDDPARSLHAASDRAPFKRRVDVVLVGQAFAPRGTTAQSLVARVAVGDVDKSIDVRADRALTRDGEIREGARWASMPLLYERAAGGPGTWNPVGVSLDAPPDAYGQRILPNLRPMSAAHVGNAEVIAPVGFGPVAASWPVRRERLRHRAEAWTETSFEDLPFGDDFDAAYFQMAPTDQQLDALRDEETLVLENLLADHPRLTTQLSGLQPKAFVDIPGQTPRDLRLVADTLWIDTDRAICTVTWRGQVPLVAREQPGRVLVAAAGPGQRLSWANLTALLKATGGDTDVTIARDEEASSPLAVSSAPPRDVTITAVGKPIAPAALPFAPGASGAAPPSAPPRVELRGPRATLEVQVPEGGLGVPPWLASQRSEPKAGSLATPTPPPRPPASIPPPRPPSPSAPLIPAPPIVEPSRAAVVAPARRGAPPPPPPLFASSRPAEPPSSFAGASNEARIGPPPRVGAEDRIALGGVDEGALAKAAFVGVAAASDAAAGGSPAARRADPRVDPQASSSSRALLELLWFDVALVARIRQVPAWGVLLQPPPRKAPTQRGAPPPPPDPPNASAATERSDVAAVLTRARAARLAEIDVAIAEALGGEGALEAPLLVVAGDLELGFDKLELLKATVGAAAPLGGADKRLKEVLDLATEMLKTEIEFAPETIDRLVARLREAWSKANRQFPPDHLEALPERMLLERRKYAKRELLDGTWIRGGLTLDGVVVPAYLPDALSKRLPLYRRFGARMIVEALPQQDQYETSALALRVIALGRALPTPANPPGS